MRTVRVTPYVSEQSIDRKKPPNPVRQPAGGFALISAALSVLFRVTGRLNAPVLLLGPLPVLVL